MNTHMEYEWYESMWFVLLVAFFWFLLIPVPIAVYLLLRRLEKQQLSRLIIAKLLGIDYYREEIALLNGEEYEESFEMEFDISELAFQQLNKTHESLRREYDLLIYKAILDEKVREETQKAEPSVETLELDALIEEQQNKKIQKEKELKRNPKKERIRPVVRKNRVVVTEEDLFEGEHTFF